MRFCRYYNTFLNSNGVPKLSLLQHRKLFNIISLENKYHILEEILTITKDIELSRDIEIKKYRIRKKLIGLTGNKYPKDVLSEFINLSKVN